MIDFPHMLRPLKLCHKKAAKAGCPLDVPEKIRWLVRSLRHFSSHGAKMRL